MQETQETNLHPWFGKIPLEKEMAIRSSIPAGKITWTEEPGGVRFLGSQRVRQDGTKSTHALRQQ